MGFEYQNGHFVLKQAADQIVSLEEIYRRNDSPVYVYDLSSIKARVEKFKKAFSSNVSIHYAMKANENSLLLKSLAQLGLGVDVVSGGELKKALDCGFPSQQIVFSGVGKTIKEIKFAIENDIKQINVECPQELIRVADLSRSLGKMSSVAFRMNPDVNPITHPYIKTGFRENKFGMDEQMLSQLIEILEKNKDVLQLRGLTLHIGSQLRDMAPLLEAIDKTIPIFQKLSNCGFELSTFDIGGGIGIDYENGSRELEEEVLLDYGKEVRKRLEPLNCEILCEPGRILVGPFGILLAEVQYIKTTPYKNFVIVNTGMHHLLRPSLYQSHHRIMPMLERPKAQKKVYDVVGPICESADVIGHERYLPELQQGDLVAILDVGAYGAVMSSGYNRHEPPLECVVDSGNIL